MGRDAILVTDGEGKGPLALASRKLGIAHRAVDPNKGIRILAGVFHIQNTNAYHSRLKEWMFGFHGVTTKYLGHSAGDACLSGYTLGPGLWLALAAGHCKG